MDQQKVYVQQQWTDEELMVDGFLSYHPVKHVTMMRMLRPVKVADDMEDSANPITPQAGHWMAYAGGDAVKAAPDDYDLRPIDAHIFAETYRRWDEPDWQPTRTEAHLQELGCMPYYKIAGIWAKQLTVETWVQGKKTTKPSLAPVGAWLCVGGKGEPRSETDAWFQAHYNLPGHRKPTEE